MECFTKAVKKPLTILAKHFILDVWQSFEYAYAYFGLRANFYKLLLSVAVTGQEWFSFMWPIWEVDSVHVTKL